MLESWEFPEKLGEDDLIKVLAFRVTFTSEVDSEVSETGSGRIALNTPQSRSAIDSALIAEVKATLGARWVEIESFHSNNIAFRALEKSLDSYTPPVTPAKTLDVVACARIAIDAFGDVTTVGVNKNVAGGFVMGEGKIWVFFLEPLPDSNYLAACYNGGSYVIGVAEGEKYEDSFVATVRNLGGELVIPDFFSFEIKRVI